MTTTTTNVSAPGGWAAVLIDMQQYFSDRGQKWGMTPERAARVLRLQERTITRLVPLKIPVAVVEYKDCGPTLPRLMSMIDGHLPWSRVIKPGDDGFARDDLRDLLRGWGADKLILLGANRGACVKSTAVGALDYGFSIYVADHLLEDYNYSTTKAAWQSNETAREFFKQKGKYYPRTRRMIEHIAETLASE
jgi:nicotinamidase-related amidase